jgi:hypothetical protein
LCVQRDAYPIGFVLGNLKQGVKDFLTPRRSGATGKAGCCGKSSSRLMAHRKDERGGRSGSQLNGSKLIAKQMQEGRLPAPAAAE